MRPRVRYDKPPLIEVVCGLLFDELEAFRFPYFGLFWSSVRDGFPSVEERQPLDPVVESFGTAPSVQMQLTPIPPLPRVWFISNDGRNLIQLQRDRFIYNWKRTEDSDSYPSYDVVIEEFEAHLEKFRQFLAEHNLGKLSFRQYELTYVNHIGPENGLDLVGEGAILVDHVRHSLPDRFLDKAPEAINWRTAYVLPGNNGRLHVSARTAQRLDGQRIIRLDLAARGIPDDRSDAGMRPWFDLAHEWITHGFSDVTSPEVQQSVWGRTQ